MPENNLISRREMLKRGLKTAAAVGLGAIALNTLGDFAPLSRKALANLSTDDLNFAAADPCVLTCAATLGPCYYNTGLVRRDITESSAGKVGLPTRLGFQIVNADTCAPVTNASIDIWHTDNQGIYSAPISTFCNGSGSAGTLAQSQRFGRGVQNTDQNGWAYFDTFFPGWYASRVTHIHATIRIGTTSIVTTQFFFLDRVAEYVYRTHPNYANRPNRDTTNLTDNVIGGRGIERVLPYVMNTRLVNGKYIQATKTIGIHTTASTCSA